MKTMLVAVLIGIMISIVVGVSLIPTILTTIDALPTTTPAGLTALVNVLPSKKRAASQGDLSCKTGLIRGTLNPFGHGNPELNFKPFFGLNKCVETYIPCIHLLDGEIVQA